MLHLTTAILMLKVICQKQKVNMVHMLKDIIQTLQIMALMLKEERQ